MIHRLNSVFGRIAEDWQDGSWILFRVLASSMYMSHGYEKLFGENPQSFTGGGITSINIGEFFSYAMPMNINLLFVAGSIELFGGFLLLIGLWTHLIALLAFICMLMAYLIAHLAWFPASTDGELTAFYFLTYLIFFTFGAGPLSADAWLAERRQEKRREKMEENL